MCGRYALTATPDEVRRLFGYVEQPNFPARYNIAPTQPVAVVRVDRGERHFGLARWGLLPTWVKDPKGFTLLINARAETAASKPAFRAAMRRRRCLIPASGWYEWMKVDGGKQPMWIRPRSGGPIGFAGLHETWLGADGSEIDTVAIVTISADGPLGRIHDRTPAVLDPAAFTAWLDVEAVDPDAALRLLQPASELAFEAIPVRSLVNAVRNDGPELQEPLTPLVA